MLPAQREAQNTIMNFCIKEDISQPVRMKTTRPNVNTDLKAMNAISKE